MGRLCRTTAPFRPAITRNIQTPYFLLKSNKLTEGKVVQTELP